VRHLGTPIGILAHDRATARDRSFSMMFQEMFLHGVAGSCFGDPRLGEKLAARSMFGLFHLDFLSWGGLTQQELTELLAKYKPVDEATRDEEWQAIGDHAEAWLGDLVEFFGAAAKAKTDLVTLFLTVQHRSGSSRPPAHWQDSARRSAKSAEMGFQIRSRPYSPHSCE
jgi:hypothetical protein